MLWKIQNLRSLRETLTDSNSDESVGLSEMKNRECMQPSQPATSNKVIFEEEFQSPKQNKRNKEAVGAKVLDPTEQIEGLGIQIRTGGLEDLNEVLELLKEIGEINPRQKERKEKFEPG